MNLTVQVKLLPSGEQSASLLATMVRFNSACDWLAGVAFAEKCANKFLLQKLAYHGVREKFGLSAQMTIRAISKVVEVYKRDRSILPKFRPHGAIIYDQRIMSWKGPDRVSLLTLSGRVNLPWIAGSYQHARINRVRGQADLVYRDGKFYLYVTIDIGDVPTSDPTEYIGIDLGQKNLVADSDGDTYTGAHTANLRRRHDRVRARLQKKGTKSAKRLLRARRRKESRFMAQTNHRIAKAIVRKAKDTDRGIALENLTGLRDRITVGRSQRRTHHSWAYAQTRGFVTYKAALDGVQVEPVDPRNSSRECPCCGLVDKRNRPTRDRFQCIGCGHAGPSDTTAAVVLRGRAERHAAERRAA